MQWKPKSGNFSFHENVAKIFTSRNSRCSNIYICRNFDVNFFNYEKLLKLPGQMHVFEAKDRAPSKYLKTCNAPKVLALKINCKVLVICNLPNGLVNGLTGPVLEVTDVSVKICIDNDPCLHHNLGGRVFTIE